jgi:hypothetical protein
VYLENAENICFSIITALGSAAAETLNIYYEMFLKSSRATVPETWS